MDQVVEREYELLYNAFPDQYGLKKWLSEAANEVMAETGQRLRADASYLLLVNFSELVIRPADQAKRVPAGEFREVVRGDIITVVREAASRSHARETREISGHQVINALTGVWGKLKTMAYNVWD